MRALEYNRRTWKEGVTFVLSTQTTILAATLWLAGSFGPLSAQTGRLTGHELQLSKGEHTHTIPLGDWIVLLGADGKQVLARGRFTEISSGEITVLGTHSNVIPLEDISAMIHGEVHSIGYYTKWGFMIGLGIGVGVTLVQVVIPALLDRGIEEEGGLGLAFPGVLIGFVWGVSKHFQRVVYQIGPHQWEIKYE